MLEISVRCKTNLDSMEKYKVDDQNDGNDKQKRQQDDEAQRITNDAGIQLLENCFVQKESAYDVRQPQVSLTHSQAPDRQPQTQDILNN